MFFKNIIVN